MIQIRGWMLAVAVCLLGAGCSAIGNSDRFSVTPVASSAGPRILCVVAHPDDEIAFAGTIFKTATYLQGACDVLVVTNGEGGFKYSTLAEPLYGVELTEERIGRRYLPDIRRRELIEGCRAMRVRDVFMLGETDHRYTRDAEEVLGEDARVWNLRRIEERIAELCRERNYDFMFTLVPDAETHGHHQAASILAARAALKLPAVSRPVLLAGRSISSAEQARHPAEFGLKGYPEVEFLENQPLVFDRTQSFGYRDRLNYKLIANWAIAAHKSQGTMQLLMNEADRELYYLYSSNSSDAVKKAEELFRFLQEAQFETKEYSASTADPASEEPASREETTPDPG